MIKVNDSFELLVRSLFLIFCAFLLALYFAPISVYAPFVSEDGSVETMTVIFCFLGAYFAIKAFILRKKFFSRNDYALLVSAALFIFMGGEEMSWGQRLIGFRPDLGISDGNLQREFNIHNIRGFTKLIYFGGFMFIVAVTGILPLLSYLSEKVRKFYSKIGAPLMPRFICALMWLGFIILVLVPQIQYGKGHIFTVFYDNMYAVEELREFYFTLVLCAYMFIEYFHLLKNETVFDPVAEQEKGIEQRGFFSSAWNSVRLLTANNFGVILAVAVLAVVLPPRIDLIKDYRLHSDKQIFYMDQDIVMIEGESANASNSGWIKRENGLFGNAAISVYKNELPKEEGYIFFRYNFSIKNPGTYRMFFAGAPAGSKNDSTFRHQYHSPYQLYIDGEKIKDVHQETTEEFIRSQLSGIFSFYLHYEYVDDFYITKLGEFYFEKGEHQVELRIDERSFATGAYAFYLDVLAITPVDWEPRKTPRSLARDIFSH